MAVKKVSYRGRTRWRARRTYICPQTGEEKQMVRLRDTKADADDADEEIKKKIEKKLARHGIHGRGTVPTVEQFWEEIIDYAEAQGRDESTIKNKRRAWKRFGWRIAKLKLNELTTRNLDKVRAALLRECGSWNTARITVDEIRAMLKLAHRWGYISEMPDLRRITAKEAGVQVDDEAPSLTSGEALALLGELRGIRNPVHYALASVQLYAGVRSGMAMGLRVGDVDFKLNVLTFACQWNDDERRLGPTKSRKVHRVPLLPELREVLEGYQRQTEEGSMIFASAATRMPIRRCSYNNQLRAAARRAGIPDPDRVTSHILRHTAGTLIGQATGSELAVKNFLGHSDTRVSRRYIHAEREHVAVAALALQGALNCERPCEQDEEES